MTDKADKLISMCIILEGQKKKELGDLQLELTFYETLREYITEKEGLA